MRIKWQQFCPQNGWDQDINIIIIVRKQVKVYNMNFLLFTGMEEPL